MIKRNPYLKDLYKILGFKFWDGNVVMPFFDPNGEVFYYQIRFTGNSKIVYFKLNDADCSTIIPANTEVGKNYQVGVNISDLYFFDSFSGETL